MLLAIDIGNTNIVLGYYDGLQWVRQWRLRTVRDRTVDELGTYVTSLLKEEGFHPGISEVVLCSVVPQLTHTMASVCDMYLNVNPLHVTYQLDLGIQNGTDVPSQVGADRLVNATAAYHLYSGPGQDRACIIVDMGTATKLDVVTSKGVLLGGVISPGLQITSDALFQRAAKLSQVDLIAPPAVIGRNTIHAIQSGLIFGYTALIEGLMPRLQDELQKHDPEAKEVVVVGTGGLINLLVGTTSIFDYLDQWLTLRGLEIIARRNRMPDNHA